LGYNKISMNRKIIFLTAVLAIAIFIVWFLMQNDPKNSNTTLKSSTAEISYVAIGDSYTTGLGVLEKDRWQNVLTENLKKEDIDIELTVNPSVSGYTVRDAINYELPVVKQINPDFVTVFIGTNDNFARRDVALFEKDLKELLDELQVELPNPQNIVLITIPDYSKSPAVAGYNSENISKSIENYNEVIKEEAEIRGLKIADIFPVSQTMTDMNDYTADGLHPSAQGYLRWEKVIFPVVLDLLKKN